MNFKKFLGMLYTEKSNKLLEDQGKYVIKIAPDCTKDQIISFMHKYFGAEVLKVNVVNMQGKVKKFKGREGKRPAYKKAILTVKGDIKLNEIV